MRINGWREAFHAAIDAARDRPAAFGKHDCLMFPARCIEAITGADPAAQFGDYQSELGAAKLMAKHGGIAGILSHAFGEAVAPNFARSGDVILVEVNGEETGGMCNGTTCVIAGVPWGLKFLPRSAILKAWRID